MSWRFGWLALAASMAFASPVVAADRDWDACQQSSSGGQDWDRQITGCSNVLSRGSRETIVKRAVALNNRGLGYDNKGDHDRAIVDYNDAISPAAELPRRVRQSRVLPRTRAPARPGHRRLQRGDPAEAGPRLCVRRSRVGVRGEGRPRSRDRGLHRVDPPPVGRLHVPQSRRGVRCKGRPRSRDRGFQRGDPPQAGLRRRIQRSRVRVQCQGRPRSRDRGLFRGDPPRRAICHRVQQSRLGLRGQGRPRARDRGLFRGDPPRPAVCRRVQQSRLGLRRQRRSRPRNRGLFRGDPPPAQLRLGLERSWLGV